jgi:large subunit ribosomal protein L25
METIELQIETRSARGKGGARSLRRDGKIPAILYGPKRGTTAVTLDAKEFERKLGRQQRTQIVRLQSASADLSGRLVLLKETQRHPLSRSPLHADLYEVDVEAKIRVLVPVHLTGKAAGVELGGILQPVRREVEVLCLPLQIPESIDIDVTPLGIHDSLHVSDLRAPSGVEIPYDVDFAVVTVLPPVVEEVRGAAAEAAEGAAAATAPAGEAKEAKEGKGA